MATPISSTPISASPTGQLTPDTPATSYDESWLNLTYNNVHWAVQVEPEEESHLRKSFDSFCTKRIQREKDGAHVPDQEITDPLSLASAFLQDLVGEQDTEVVSKLVLGEIQAQFLSDTDVHSLVSTWDARTQTSFLKSYYAGLRHAQSSDRYSSSALFNKGPKSNLQVYAICGGQGSSNKSCVRELQDVCNVYGPLLEDLIEVAADTLTRLNSTSRAAELDGIYEIDLRKWLVRPETVPADSIIAAAPVSFPLIGLLSLSHFAVTCKVLGKTPGQLRNSLRGVTGHSQGVIVAAAMAASTSWDSFHHHVRFALEALFWIGIESHQEMMFPQLSRAAAQECIDQGEGAPSPMLSVRGLDRTAVTKLLKDANQNLKTNEQVYLALVNAKDNVVIAGPPRSLCGLNARLRNQKAQDGSSQSRQLFNQRKPVVRHEFLPMSAAFHSPYADAVVPRVLHALRGYTLTGNDLGTSLFHTQTGHDLKRLGNQDIIEPLVRMITSEVVEWPRVSHVPEMAHVVDFGPGRIGSLVQKATEGMGVRVISAADLRPPSKDVGAKAELFSAFPPPTPPNWGLIYRPRLAKDASGTVTLETRMTQMMGVPPVMVAGMTPTTVPWDVVASIMQAGYHAELAGGGYLRAEQFEEAIRKLCATIPTKSGITCNIIYASPKTVAWQIPAIRRMIQDGHPIDGLTIGAGVPSAEVVDDYASSLGLKHISFKPGSLDSILQVIAIANAHPGLTIGLQWTGGRGGGHHSFEDFHAPILETYGKIRKCDNIVLIAGSGFGGAEDTLPYLTGEWSLSMGHPRMPFDGVLLGSRMMVAKEAHTAPQAKELIVRAQGVNDAEWHKTYEKEAGGVITVTSEMGQPIHKLATRGVLLWKDLDRKIFSIADRSKRLAELQKNKAELIYRLNQDFQKPWFGLDAAGSPAEVEDLTYYDVLRRLVALMYVQHQHRWIDPSYRRLVRDFAIRAQERLSTAHPTDVPTMDDPQDFLDKFRQAHPSASRELLHPEDVAFFISLCLRRGQKPVNFIPRLDENFESWFKKDSLWQAEDIDAVVDQDIQRVCIIHGPVAARYSSQVDEPSKTILDNIMNAWTEELSKGSAVAGMAQDHFTFFPRLSSAFSSLIVEDSQHLKSYSLTKAMPDPESFLEHLGHEVNGWAKACIMDQMIVRGQRRHANPVRAAVMPIPGHTLSIHYGDDRTVKALTVTKTSNSSDQSRPVLTASSRRGNIVKVVLTEPTKFDIHHAELELVFEYQPNRITNHLTEITEDRMGKIKAFYAELWLGSYPASLRDANVYGEFAGYQTTITREMVQNFVRVADQAGPSQSYQSTPAESAPLGICIVLAWEALVQPLLIRAIDGDLWQLLHRSNEFRYVHGASPLRVGDVVDSSARIQAITNSARGKTIEVAAEVRRDGSPVVVITSTFFIRGVFADYEKTFRRSQEPRVQLEVKSEREYALLMSREWVHTTKDKSDLLGRTLVFEMETQTTNEGPDAFSTLQVSGDILTMENGTLEKAGTIFYETGRCHGNPVTTFLERHGAPVDAAAQALPQAGWNGESSWTIRLPKSNAAYAKVSKDTNPIHVSPIYANFAQLPGTVTHGMLTSAAVQRLVESAVGEADNTRFRRYSASFEGIVLPGDELTVELQHIGMMQGRMVFKIQAHNKETSTLVLEAEAEVEQQTTAYVFTGQGSQEKGMGMVLYEKSPAAKKLWDRADKHLSDLYGFSIIDIVRNDPKMLTIHFGGQRGRKIRQNYLNMTIQRTQPDGTVSTEPIVKNLNANSLSYTFSDQRGLLYSTQFAQPALTIMEMASFEDARSKGLIQTGAAFAGHSLGEYSALGAIGQVMSMEALVGLVFYRGLTMQVAMERDQNGKTEFSMVAVNPSRVSKAFDQAAFERVVGMIAHETQVLLEVVNYNVQGRQYVCAGHLRALWTMGQVLDTLARSTPATLADPDELLAIVRRHAAAGRGLAKNIALERGTATIPLKGIDVPFHSSYIRTGIEPYRRYLETTILPENVDADKLVDKFIPNVTAKPFSVDREYVQDAARVMDSANLRRLLEEWDASWQEDHGDFTDDSMITKTVSRVVEPVA